MKKHQRNHSGCAFELTMAVMSVPVHPGCAGFCLGEVLWHLERVYETTEDHRAHVEEDMMSGLMIWCDKYPERPK